MKFSPSNYKVWSLFIQAKWAAWQYSSWMCQVKFYFHFQKVHFFSLKSLIFAHNHTYIMECLLLHIYNGHNFNWLLYDLSFPNTALFMYSVAAVKKINSGFLGKYFFQKLEGILISAISLVSWEKIHPFREISKRS